MQLQMRTKAPPSERDRTQQNRELQTLLLCCLMMQREGTKQWHSSAHGPWPVSSRSCLQFPFAPLLMPSHEDAIPQNIYGVVLPPSPLPWLSPLYPHFDSPGRPVCGLLCGAGPALLCSPPHPLWCGVVWCGVVGFGLFDPPVAPCGVVWVVACFGRGGPVSSNFAAFLGGKGGGEGKGDEGGGGGRGGSTQPAARALLASTTVAEAASR